MYLDEAQLGNAPAKQCISTARRATTGHTALPKRDPQIFSIPAGSLLSLIFEKACVPDLMDPVSLGRRAATLSSEVFSAQSVIVRPAAVTHGVASHSHSLVMS